MEERKFLKKKQKARDDGNLEQWVHYCRELGELYRNSGKYQDALFQYKEEERVNGSLGNPVAVAISNRMIGEIYCDLGEFEEALKYQKKHLDIAKMENVDIEVQRALANIGRTYFCKAESLTSRQPEYNSSLACAKNAYLKSLKVCENLKGIGLLVQMEMKCRLLMNLGLVLECQNDMSKAVDYIEQAIQIAKKHELWEDLCRCYSAIGMLYQRSGNHTRALRSLNLALEVAERLDSRVKTSCEILLSKAEVLFLIADFGGARQALLKAYKLKTPNERDRATIEKNLRIAAALCQTEEKVLMTSSDNYEKLRSLYETLGDGSASVSNFKKAVEFYLKMLECAEKAGEEGEKLCPIYVSLSQTYKDDGQYDLALEYAKKELKLWLDVPQEACKSCMNIADILELKNSSYLEVCGAYSKAKDFALKANDWKLVVTTLRNLQNYQKNVGRDDLVDETQKEIKELCEEHNISDSSDEEEGNDEESQKIGAYIDLEELTAPESSSDEDGVNKLKEGSKVQSRRRGKGLMIRRNDKGETALHRSCISGNLALTRSLIDRGHPLNLRDNCGWTPLHEACNHGYEEIVSLLIEKGAQVNDRGGIHCGGVTPIHDAASCGNLSIIRLLVNAGASTLGKTDKGETPLDCLRNWYARVENEIDNYTKGEYEAVEKLLRRDLEKVGEETIPSKESNENKRQRERRINVEEGMGKEKEAIHGYRRPPKRYSPLAAAKRLKPSESSSEDECIDPGSNSSSSDEAMLPRMSLKVSSTSKGHLSKPTVSSSSEYAKTIASLKNRQTLLSLNSDKELSLSPPSEKGPHLNPNEIDLDNWLEDDEEMLRPSKRTKKSDLPRAKLNTFLGTATRNNAPRVPIDSSPLEEGDNNYVEEIQNEEISLEVSKDVVREITREVIREEIPLSQPVVVAPIVESSRRNSEEAQPTCQLIKVEVEGNMLLVPVNSSVHPTFEHLAQEVSKRYFEFKGVRLELSLHTRDGALLSKSDPVSILSLLGESAKSIVAKVVSMDLPPISESYQDACVTNKMCTNEQVMHSLELSQRTRTLRLDNLLLKPQEIPPLLKALSHRSHSICNLNLSGNEIGDEGIKLLGSSLASMKNLSSLDISSNGINASGFLDFLKILLDLENAGKFPLQSFQELKLSHNHLTDKCVPYLIKFLNKLTSLNVLSLADCDITSFDLGDEYSSPKWYSVEEIDLSYNFLGAETVASFLRCLCPSKIKILRLGRTREKFPRESDQEVGSIAQELALFLDQDEYNRPSNLVELDLSQTGVTDSDVCELLRVLTDATNLERLTLECNPALTSLTLRRVLQQGGWPKLKLNITGCPRVLDYIENDESVTSWMNYQSSKQPWECCEISLTSSENSSCAIDKLTEMWNKALGAKAFAVQEMFGYLKLGVKTD